MSNAETIFCRFIDGLYLSLMFAMAISILDVAHEWRAFAGGAALAIALLYGLHIDDRRKVNP